MRYTGQGYMALLRKRQRVKKGSSAHRKLGKQASTYRKRMISRNRVSSYRRKTPKQCARMNPESKRLYDHLIKHADGKKIAGKWKQFWMLNCTPPSITLIKGDGKKKITPLLELGKTNAVFLSSKNKGERGQKKRVIKGAWTGATEKTGKHVLLLTNRPVKGKWKLVGYATRTDYIPPADVEALGTPKAGSHWKHIHGEADGMKVPREELKWPPVYADRNGKVDKDSNFVYGATKHGKITTWMYH